MSLWQASSLCLSVLFASLAACDGTVSGYRDGDGVSESGTDAAPTVDAATEDTGVDAEIAQSDAGPGDAGLGDAGVPGRFEAVFAGPGHSCGLASDGRAFCWGSDASKQLGELDDADDDDEAIPVEVNLAPLGGERFTTLGLGSSHTCGVTQSGKAYCWGDDGLGQVGNGMQAFGNVEAAPALVQTAALASGEVFTDITAGGNYTCAVTNRSKAYCWGQASGGRLGQTTNATQHEPAPVDTSNLAAGESFVQVDAGRNYACGVTDQGRAYCWGFEGEGELGNGAPIATISVPERVDDSGLSSGEEFTQVACELTHTCAVTSLGATYCWGLNVYGQLGDDSDDDSLVPVRVVMTEFDAGETVTSVSVGSIHSCVHSSLDRVLCFGHNNNAQLGNGRSSPILPGAFAPSSILVTNLNAGEKLLSVSAGSLHNCAVGDSGSAYCWGSNGDGQIGSAAAPDLTEIPTEVEAFPLRP